MGTLFDLLKATAAGQSDTLGRWRRAVSQVVDGLQQPAFGYAKRITSDQTITSGQNVLFNVGNVQGNILFDVASGSFFLETGKLYLLSTGGRLVNFTDAATGALDLKFVDDNNNVLTWPPGTADCPALTITPQTGTPAESTGAMLQFPYEPGAVMQTRTVKVRCTASQGAGSADVPANRFWFSVLEIGAR